MDPFGMGGYGGGGYGAGGGQQQEQMMMSSCCILICCCVIAGVVLWMYSSGKMGGTAKETTSPSPSPTFPPITGTTEAPMGASEGCSASLNRDWFGRATPPMDPAKCTSDIVGPWNCSYWEVKDVLGSPTWQKVKDRNVPNCSPGTVYASDTKFAVYNRIKTLFPIFRNDMMVEVALGLISLSQYQKTDWATTIGVQTTQWDVIARNVLNPVQTQVNGLWKAFNAPPSPLSITFMLDVAWGGQSPRLISLMAKQNTKNLINMQEKLWLETIINDRFTYYAYKSHQMWKQIAVNPANYYLSGVNVNSYATARAAQP